MVNEIIIKIPDIGGATNIDVIEILVKPGDQITTNTSLITLESDKASMEIPSPYAGKVNKLIVKLGDKVSEGDDILALSPQEEPDTASFIAIATKEEQGSVVQNDKQEEKLQNTQTQNLRTNQDPLQNVQEISAKIEESQQTLYFAGPGVRRMAREFGVNLVNVKGTGRKSRVTKQDIRAYIKAKVAKSYPYDISLASQQVSPPIIDFSKFGDIESKPLNKIKRLTGLNVHSSWATIPHVTQFDEADITELETFRKSAIELNTQADYKLTILSFVIKVVSKALVIFPQFNTSLNASGEHLIYKHYVNIGFAVETANGLVVPVIKEANQLSVSEIALELTRLSKKAREKGLSPVDMNGGCFTVSSLGGIGGTAFTPIINSPEVAILGLSRATIKPVYVADEFRPRLMLPLSLSYDHRVIDGAEAARFTRGIADMLSDIRRVLL